jgi:hypothetical protein
MAGLSLLTSSDGTFAQQCEFHFIPEIGHTAVELWSILWLERQASQP